MKKFNLYRIVILAVFALAIGACGKGVDRSNPKSVADAALECFDTGDYEGMKALANPANQSLVKELNTMIEMSRRYNEKYGEKELKLKNRIFKSVKEVRTGKNVTSESKDAVAVYAGDWPNRVILVQVDGEWCFEQMK